MGEPAANNYAQCNASYTVSGFLNSLFATPLTTEQHPNAETETGTNANDPNADSEQGNPDSDELAAIQSE